MGASFSHKAIAYVQKCLVLCHEKRKTKTRTHLHNKSGAPLASKSSPKNDNNKEGKEQGVGVERAY
jgi:hypothetical protein